jgi:hypothetical protein
LEAVFRDFDVKIKDLTSAKVEAILNKPKVQMKYLSEKRDEE